jgi:hypothetical protein
MASKGVISYFGLDYLLPHPTLNQGRFHFALRILNIYHSRYTLFQIVNTFYFQKSAAIWQLFLILGLFNREYHGGLFGGVLETVLPSVSVIKTLNGPKSVLTVNTLLQKSFQWSFDASFILRSSKPEWCDNIIIYSCSCQII